MAVLVPLGVQCERETRGTRPGHGSQHAALCCTTVLTITTDPAPLHLLSLYLLCAGSLLLPSFTRRRRGDGRADPSLITCFEPGAVSCSPTSTSTRLSCQKRKRVQVTGITPPAAGGGFKECRPVFFGVQVTTFSWLALRQPSRARPMHFRQP